MRNSLKVITEKQSIAMQFYCQIIEFIFFPLAWAKHTREQAKKPHKTQIQKNKNNKITTKSPPLPKQTNKYPQTKKTSTLLVPETSLK